MHVAGTVRQVEDLAGLGDGAQQRVVASLASPLVVKAHGNAFCEAAGGLHDAVEVQRQHGQPENPEPLQYQRPHRVPAALHATFVGCGEGPRYRARVRQGTQAQDPQHQGIVPIVAGVAQLSVAEQEMDDELQHHRPQPVDGRAIVGAETAPQPGFQAQSGEQLLEHHEAGVRGQLLVLELHVGKSERFTVGLDSATLHRTSGLLFELFGFRRPKNNPTVGRLLFLGATSLHLSFVIRDRRAPLCCSPPDLTTGELWRRFPRMNEFTRI